MRAFQAVSPFFGPSMDEGWIVKLCRAVEVETATTPRELSMFVALKVGVPCLDLLLPISDSLEVSNPPR